MTKESTNINKGDLVTHPIKGDGIVISVSYDVAEVDFIWSIDKVDVSSLTLKISGYMYSTSTQ